MNAPDPNLPDPEAEAASRPLGGEASSSQPLPSSEIQAGRDAIRPDAERLQDSLPESESERHVPGMERGLVAMEFDWPSQATADLAPVLGDDHGLVAFGSEDDGPIA